MYFIKVILLGFLIFSFFSCEEGKTVRVSDKYKTEIENWHNKRITNLKKETGWLNLVGLFWLKEGENNFGSDASNDIQFPSDQSPAFIGKIVKKDSVITTSINENVNVTFNDKPVKKIVMKNDISGDPTVLSLNSLRWFIIKRGEKYGVRLRNLEVKLLTEFEGIERFPINKKWKIQAKYVAFDKPKKIAIPTIIGTIEEEEIFGTLNFAIDNKDYSLSPTQAGKGLFIVFADLTSGAETYGGGRFLYVDGPDSNNNVILDFNNAYNPPCAFTKYATCPLPPDENKLRVEITAGEKNYGKGH